MSPNGGLARANEKGFGVFISIGVMVTSAIALILLDARFPRVGDSAYGRTVVQSLLEIGLAIHNYVEKNGRLPPATVTDKTGRPLYGWRVAILPCVNNDTEVAALARAFHFDEPWDSENNCRLLPRMPNAYRSPVSDQTDATFYQVIVGPGTAFERPGLTFNDFPDGISNCFLVVEAADAVPWTKPADLIYDSNGPLPKFGGHYMAPDRVWAHRVISRRPIFGVCLGDGACFFFPTATDEGTLRKWVVRNGGKKEFRY